MRLNLLFSVELKNHQYFEGVDWEKVNEKRLASPFGPINTQIRMGHILDLRKKLKINENDYIDADTAERLNGKFFDYSRRPVLLLA